MILLEIENTEQRTRRADNAFSETCEKDPKRREARGDDCEVLLETGTVNHGSSR